MFEFSEMYYIRQLVTESTRQNNALGLAKVTQDNFVSNITPQEHLGSCDHKSVHVDIRAHARVIENRVLIQNFIRTPMQE